MGVEVKSCYIKDAIKHEANQKLLHSIIDRKLESVAGKTSEEHAKHLSIAITEIAQSLLNEGFLADAYAVPETDQNSLTAFNCFEIWAGDKNFSSLIPLTFFIYVWPAEEQTSCPNSLNSSIIHSHPIPCAFAVLHGSILQKNYEVVCSDAMDKKIKFANEKIFNVGEGEIDDLKNQFIHKLYNPGTNSAVSLSLHAYGLPSAEKVMACFRDTESTCSYENYKVN
jgi:hypothetical protein